MFFFDKQIITNIVFKNRSILFKYLGNKKIKFLNDKDKKDIAKKFYLNLNIDEIYLILKNNVDYTKKNEVVKDFRLVIKYNNLMQRVEISLNSNYVYEIKISDI